ncbi:hypothetical protein [Polluticoccus soli]|uniref:hypothetical protein n=2 Tax=Bacteria TaxID=2 RepID=UPI0023E128EB|nr:hypothetical protein [Flavipsychrobacter sp. JY13-12]
MGLNELETEIGNWLQKLEGMQLENTDMKTRLADAVKHAVSPSALEEAEQFQSRFINKDTVISFMRADIKKQAKKLENGTPDIQSWQNKLRSDMAKMETEFNNMKSVFTSYLLQL